MIVCPPKKIAGVPNRKWTDLVSAYGEAAADLAFRRNGFELPDVETAGKLLRGEKSVKKTEAEAATQINIHDRLKALAGIYRDNGTKDAQEFADDLGLELADVERAWKEVTEGKVYSEKDILSVPYDVDRVRGMLSVKEQGANRTQLEQSGVNAISGGATNIDDFKAAMAGNPEFDALPENSKESLYYNSVSSYATSVAIKQEEEIAKIINLKDQTWLQKVIQTFTNKMTRVRDVQEQIEGALGIKILNEANAALKYELLIGKSISKIEDKQREISDRNNKNSLFSRATADGVDIDELGMYMYALHAPDYNASVANKRQEEFNKEVEDFNKKIKEADSQSLKTRYQNDLKKLIENRGKAKLLEGAGSGMTDKQAEEIIKEVEQSGKKDLFDKYAQEFREKVINKTLDEQFKYGLITQELYDKLKTNYKNYVPLQVVEKAMKKRVGAGGKGVSVKGKDIFRAKGSDLYKYTDRYNPIFSSMFAYENAIMRGERNQADQALIKLAELDEQNEIFQIHKPSFTPVVNSNNEVSNLLSITSPNLKENSVEFKVEGKPVLVEIKDKALRDALQGQGLQRGIRGLYLINSWLRATSTLWNPNFLVTNALRDIQTAIVNIQSEKKDLNIKNVTAKVVNPKNLMKAASGLMADSKGNYTSEWAKAAKEMRDNGGKVSWFQTETLEEYSEKLKKDVAKIRKGESLPLRTINKLGTKLLLYQSVVEQSIRLTTFKALRDVGVSAEESARAAKNITVNFENKGTWSGLIDSFYLFGTASANGSYRIAKSLARSKTAKTIAGGLFAYGLLEAALNSMLGGEDESDRDIDDGVKERNFVLVNPTDPKQEPYKFPMAYGMNVFKYAGNLTYDVANGRKSPIDATSKMFMCVYNQVSPFQGATPMQALSPTFLDPFIQHMENKNYLGSMIKPEQPKFRPKVKESDLYFSSARPASVWTAKKLNKITGGTAVEKGFIDVSPEILDHYYDAFTGGTGVFIADATQTTANLSDRVIKSIHGEEMKDEDKISMRKIPFIKVFFGSKPEKEKLNFIYETFERSGTEEISQEDFAKFTKSINRAIGSKLLERDKADEMYKTVKDNRIKLEMYRRLKEFGYDDKMIRDMNPKDYEKYLKEKRKQ